MWEAETIRNISSAYVAAVQDYTKNKDKPMPYLTDVGRQQAQRDYSARRLAKLREKANA